MRWLVLATASMLTFGAIAAEVPGVDLVVGGHSHTYLSASDPKRQGPYPTWVDTAEGGMVPVVQAWLTAMPGIPPQPSMAAAQGVTFNKPPDYVWAAPREGKTATETYEALDWGWFGNDWQIK